MNCILCGATEYRLLHQGTDRLYATTRETFSLVECANCKLVRMDPRPPDDELHKFYPGQYWFQPKPSLAGRLEELYRKLMIRDHVIFTLRASLINYFQAPKRVLDVGCGGGLFLRELRRPGIDVVGLDVSVAAASVALRQNGISVAVGDLRSAPYPAASMDLITMFHVLEHVPDPMSFLNAAKGLLKPGGSLVAQVPNIDCLQYKWLGAKWSGLDIPRHLHCFKTSDMKRMLEACGYKIVRVKHFSWRDNPAGLATSIFPALEPVARVVRKLDRGPFSKLLKNFLYLALVMAAIPFAAVEAALQQGSSVMIEAKPVS